MSTIVSPTPQRAISSRFLEGRSMGSPLGDSSFAHESSVSDSEPSHFDFASDDDEAGVFFGAHNPIERKIVASLSRSIPPSPASCSLSTIAERRASLANRSVVTQDSREFLRRRTLVPGAELEKSLPGSGDGDKSDGASLDRGIESEDTAVEPEAGPSTHSLQVSSTSVELETDDDTPEHEMPSFHIEEGMFVDQHMTDDDETDKENTMIPELYYESEDEMDSSPPVSREDDNKPITLGFSGAGADDISAEIDMGGLSLLDLDDPDLGPLEDTSITFDHMDDDTDPSDSDRSLEQPTSQSVLGDPFFENKTPSGPSTTVNNMFMTVHQTSPVPSPDVPRPAISSESSPQPLLATPLISTPRQTFPQTPSEVTANNSYDSELDSPIVARGPIAVPAFSVAPPPASSTTPLRGLEPGPSCSNLRLPGATPEIAMNLPSLDSPTQQRPPIVTPHRSHPSLAPLPKTPGSVLKNRTPPSRLNASHVPVSQRPERVLKASQRIEAPDPADEERRRRRAAKAEARAKERAAAIRGHLDFMVTSKMSSFEPVARSSASPSIASKSPRPASAALRPVAKSPASAPIRPADKSLRPAMRPASVSASSRSQTVSVGTPKAIERRLPVPAPTGIPVAKSSKPPGATGIPRPVFKRTVIASSVQRAPPTKVYAPEVKLAVTSLNVRPQPSPVPSLKRPFSAIQTSERTALTVGSAPTRSTLGFPARPFREPMRKTFGTQAVSLGSGHIGAAFSHSPARGSVMGKPVRPTGMTPQRTITTVSYMHGDTETNVQAPTPVRTVAGTPLKQPPFRPTPAGSVQKNTTLTPLIHPVPRHFSAAPAPLMPRLSEARSEAPADDDNTQMDTASPAPAPAAPEESADEKTDEKMDVEDSAPPLQELSIQSASRAQNGSQNGSENGAQNGSDSRSSASPEQTPEQQSPTPARGARRSGRTTRAPPARAATPAAPKAKAAPAPSIVPGISERALRTTTQRNTMRNQVYLCAIDRQIVRVPGPRPPSPTSKIPKSAERDEEEQKAARDARARRRGRPSDETSSEAEEECPPAVEVVEQAVAPGEDEEYACPARPAKRARIATEDESANGGAGAGADGDTDMDSRASADASGSRASSASGKYVRWSRSLTVIRGGLGSVAVAREHQGKDTPMRDVGESSRSLRSCLKSDAQVALDEHGNVLDRPTEKLKRSKVTIQAVFYDGEEPVAFNYNVSASQGTRSKKK